MSNDHKSYRWSGRLKNLKDSLMEYAVLNMDLLFPHDLTRDEIPEFPDGLFEGILCKSYDMGYRIRRNYLIPCLAIRDKLKWTDLSYIARQKHLDHSEIGSACSTGFDLQNLTANISLDVPDYVETMEKIYKMCHSLRCLKIRSGGWDNDKVGILWKKYAQLPPLILTRLSLEGYWKHFPLNTDAKALKLLHIVNCRMNIASLDVITAFVNLRELFLEEVIFIEGDMDRLTDVLIKAPRYLRRLALKNLIHSKPNDVTRKCREAIFDTDIVIKLMENLDHLEWMYTTLNESISTNIIVPERKLKVLLVDNFKTGSEITGEFVKSLKQLADKVGDYNTPDGLLTMAEENPFENDLSSMMHRLRCMICRENLQPFAIDKIKRVVNLFLDKLFFSPRLYTLSGVIGNLGINHFSKDFLLRYAQCESSSGDKRVSSLRVEILEAFTRDNHLCKMIKKNEACSGALMQA